MSVGYLGSHFNQAHTDMLPAGAGDLAMGIAVSALAFAALWEMALLAPAVLTEAQMVEVAELGIKLSTGLGTAAQGAIELRTGKQEPNYLSLVSTPTASAATLLGLIAGEDMHELEKLELAFNAAEGFETATRAEGQWTSRLLGTLSFVDAFCEGNEDEGTDEAGTAGPSTDQDSGITLTQDDWSEMG